MAEDEKRHDDTAEQPPQTLPDDADDDFAEQEADRVSESDDEELDRDLVPEKTEVGDTARKLEAQAEPLLKGPEVAGLPKWGLLGIAAFLVAFLAVFLLLWALFDTLGIFLGIVVGTAAGLLAAKLLADRAG